MVFCKRGVGQAEQAGRRMVIQSSDTVVDFGELRLVAAPKAMDRRAPTVLNCTAKE